MADNKKNILIISFCFPPSAEVGAKRFAFLSQIFNDKYFSVHILAPTDNNYLLKDYSISYSGTVYRVGMFPSIPFRKKGSSFIGKFLKRLWESYFSLVDPYSGWILPSILKGLEVLKKQHIDAIIITGPPFSPMLCAYILSRFSGAKLIMDYRDPWTNHIKIYPKLLGKKINILIERLVIKCASAIVFTSKIMKDNFIRDFGEDKKDKCHIIANGFNPSNEISPLYLEKDKKVIIYAGQFRGERRIGLLIEPLRQLIDQKEITNDEFRIHIFGRELYHEEKQEIENNGMGEIIKKHQYVEHDIVLRYLKGADILFLPSGADYRYAIPAKFYDYLRVQRPILAVAPHNSGVECIMKEINCGEFAIINSKESVKQCFRQMLKEEKKYTFSGSEKYIWNKLAEKYAKVIYGVLEI